MRRNNTDSPHYIDWIDKAESDLNVARVLYEHSDENEMIAFHCQQCIEKALKGYILFKTKKHFDGHNLTFLCKKAISLNHGFDEWYDESIALNHYYIETRYPSDIGLDISEKRINKVFTMAKDMFGFIEKELENYQRSEKGENL